jgi:hypothetical protein
LKTSGRNPLVAPGSRKLAGALRIGLMITTRSFLVFTTILAGLSLLLPACGKPKPLFDEQHQRQQVEKKPPPTEPEIVRELSVPLTAYFQMGKDQALPQEDIDQMMGKLAQGKNKHRVATEDNPNGPKALLAVANRIEDTMSEARGQKNWHKTLYGTRLLEAVTPDNPKITRYRTQAQVEINRPQITITGFVGIDDETTISMTVFMPSTKKTEKAWVRIGEEFADSTMQLIDVIGDNRGVEVLYLANGETYEVYRGAGSR